MLCICRQCVQLLAFPVSQLWKSLSKNLLPVGKWSLKQSWVSWRHKEMESCVIVLPRWWRGQRGGRVKDKEGRNSLEPESPEDITVGCRVEGVSREPWPWPCLCQAVLMLPLGGIWEAEQSALGDMGSVFTSPSSRVFLSRAWVLPANQWWKGIALELIQPADNSLSFSSCRCPQRYVACVGGQDAELGWMACGKKQFRGILLHCRQYWLYSPKFESIYSGWGLEPVMHFQGVLGQDKSSLYCGNSPELLFHGSSPIPDPCLLPQSAAAFLRFAQGLFDTQPIFQGGVLFSFP